MCHDDGLKLKGLGYSPAIMGCEMSRDPWPGAQFQLVVDLLAL